MFHTQKDKLVATLKVLRKKACAYMGTPCDCKYGMDEKSSPHSEENGCPELRSTEAMTPEEYEKLINRINGTII